METIAEDIASIERVLFKSYYVVWKPRDKKKICEAYQKFKSYYVVWKLSEWSVCDVHHVWFKSYYVVWKPACFEMKWNEIEEFKSYYVVWKLDTSERWYVWNRTV